MFHPITSRSVTYTKTHTSKKLESGFEKEELDEKPHYFPIPSSNRISHRLNTGSFSQFPSEIMGLIHDFLSNKNPDESYWRLLTEICHLMPSLPFEFEGKTHDYAQHVVMSLSKRTGLSWNEILRTAKNFASHTKNCPENNPISLFTIHDYPILENFVKGNIEIHTSTQKKILHEIFTAHVKKEFELTMGKNFLSQIYLDRFSIVSSILYAQSMRFFSNAFKTIYDNELRGTKINFVEYIGISIICAYPLWNSLFIVYFRVFLTYQNLNMANIESFKKLKALELDMSEHPFFQEKDIQALYSIISEMIKNFPEQEREELNSWLVNSFSFR